MKIEKNWLLGFLENSSEFNILIRHNAFDITIKEVLIEFKVYSTDIQFLYALKKFFGYGRVIQNRYFVINQMEHLVLIVLPFFLENVLVTNKKFEFFKFKKALDLVKNNSRLDDVHFIELEQLQAQILQLRNKGKDKVQIK